MAKRFSGSVMVCTTDGKDTFRLVACVGSLAEFKKWVRVNGDPATGYFPLRPIGPPIGVAVETVRRLIAGDQIQKEEAEA